MTRDILHDELERIWREQELTVKQQIAFYASTRTYQPVLDVHGWGGLTAQLHKKSVEGDWKGMADLITDDVLALNDALVEFERHDP